MLLWRVAAELGGRPRSSILLGVALFGSGYLLEAAGIVTKRIEESGFELPHLIRAGLEESVELAGWILVAAGLQPGCSRRLAAALAKRREQDHVPDRVPSGQHHRQPVDPDAEAARRRHSVRERLDVVRVTLLAADL